MRQAWRDAGRISCGAWFGSKRGLPRSAAAGYTAPLTTMRAVTLREVCFLLHPFPTKAEDGVGRRACRMVALFSLLPSCGSFGRVSTPSAGIGGLGCLHGGRKGQCLPSLSSCLLLGFGLARYMAGLPGPLTGGFPLPVANRTGGTWLALYVWTAKAGAFTRVPCTTFSPACLSPRGGIAA